MSKILIVFFLFFIFNYSTFASNESIKIISRSEWGAEEEYRYLDSTYWQDILEKRKQANLDWQKKLESMTEEQKAKIQAESLKASEKRNAINEILMTDYANDNKLSEIIKKENGRDLAWNIEKSENIKGIIIHHTLGVYTDSYEAIRSIYKYHSLIRGWGDIGYNYLIGENGEIFEGRAGGDYAVGAHALWNNRSTLAISIIGDYSEKPINEKQYESLKNLINYLGKKYNIDFSKQFNYHNECISSNCSSPLNTSLLPAIVGHRDAGHTDCPGDALYNQIIEIRSNLIKEFKLSETLKNKITQSIKSKIENISESNLIDFLAKLENKIDKSTDPKNTEILKVIKSVIFNKIELDKQKLLGSQAEKDIYFDDTNKIKIKLSYRDNDYISIIKGDTYYNFRRDGDFLIYKGKKIKEIKLSSINSSNNEEKGSFLEIYSWDRKPSWDKTGKLNDNKFRGDLHIYVKDGKIIVVNELYLNDYLKGLGEVSDSENTQKIKTIIISARTYARWYMQKQNRKFEGEEYDGSDDPDVFQKYLGYGLEIRSPKISKIVEETKDEVITYNGEIIKPWYFSSSDGKTMSFIDYCSKSDWYYIQANPNVDKSNITTSQIINFCKIEGRKYPFLSSVVDPSNSSQKLGHGVGVPGTGVKYLAEKGWTYDIIVKYFLKGVDIKVL